MNEALINGVEILVLVDLKEKRRKIDCTTLEDSACSDDYPLHVKCIVEGKEGFEVIEGSHSIRT